jgi:hypothetical protein
MDHPWKPVFTHRQSQHHIQPQKGKIGQIILGKRFPLKMRMDKTETPEPQDPGSITGELGKGQSFLVSNNNSLDVPSTADEYTNLTPDFIRQLG